MAKEERRKRVRKKIHQIILGVIGKAQDDLSLLKSTKNGEESKSITCL